ncbi:hypothetical protein LWM68_13435 [Niabella sp. W65]|nr:hypothetical protein [Niabella sp. W65]MCH7363663.1 hypothetical protein [Niabella sp. W65]
MIAEQHSNEDEDAYQQEAERRLALHRKGDPKKDNPGNRIKIIGYDGNADYKDLDHLRATPGDIVTRFNDRDQSLFSIFIHAPFKEHLEALGDDKRIPPVSFSKRGSKIALTRKASQPLQCLEETLIIRLGASF